LRDGLLTGGWQPIGTWPLAQQLAQQLDVSKDGEEASVAPVWVPGRSRRLKNAADVARLRAALLEAGTGLG
jgi:hypothetical protein